MRKSIKEALEQQLPSLAECGGFMYLHDTLTDRDGTTYQMAGVIPAECQYMGKLVRFGYVEVQLPQGLTEKGTAERPEPEKIKAHEFHYFDSTANGEDCIATKPVSRKKLEVHSCIGRSFLGLSTSVLSVRSKVCEMVFGKNRKAHLRLQKKQGCANMDNALDRYIIHAVWKRKKMTVS